MVCDTVSIPSDLSIYQNWTVFTSDQLTDYLYRISRLSCLDGLLFGSVRNITITLTGLVGFPTYFLMLASLYKCRQTLNGPTMIYHLAMIFLEIIHMIVMIQSGFVSIYIDSIDRTAYSYLVYQIKFNKLWDFGDGCKLAVSALTTFITLERCIAVCIPTKYKRISTKKVAYCGVMASILVGSAHLWHILSTQIDYNLAKGQYEGVTTWFGDTWFNKFTAQFIVYSRGVLCLAIFSFCVATAIGLRRHASKVGDMNSSGARKNLEGKKRLCAFCFVLGISTVVDHVVWGFDKSILVRGRSILALDAVWTGRSYQDALGEIWYANVVVISDPLQSWTGQIIHGWRFFIYLIFNKTMRDGFGRVIKCKDEGQDATN